MGVRQGVVAKDKGF